MNKFKVCIKCNQSLELNSANYYKRKCSKDGYRNDCKDCVKKRRKEYRNNNKELISEQHAKWRGRNKEYIQRKGELYYRENKEKILKKVKSYYRENTEKVMKTKKLYLENNKVVIAERKRKWARNNKEKIYEYGLKRRSRKHFVQFEGVARRKLLDRDNWTCRQCGVKVHDRSEGGIKKSYLWNDEFKAHIDHIIPLSKGGDSTLENLQVLCRTCNLSKGDKTELEVEQTRQIKISL